MAQDPVGLRSLWLKIPLAQDPVGSRSRWLKIPLAQGPVGSISLTLKDMRTFKYEATCLPAVARHGRPWPAMACHIPPWLAIGHSWPAMADHGPPWAAMGSHGAKFGRESWPEHLGRSLGLNTWQMLARNSGRQIWLVRPICPAKFFPATFSGLLSWSNFLASNINMLKQRGFAC